MAVNLNDTTPAAPSTHTNVAWQKDGSGNVSGNVPTAISASTIQNANKVLAGPTTGSDAAPTFRGLVAADIPAIAESGVTGLVSDLAAKAPLASPTFTGTPAAPTPSTGDNSTTIATTAFVKAQGYGTGSGTVTHTGGALTSGLPAIGAGSADIAVGTKSGNTTEFANSTGSKTSGHLASWDADGNLVDAGEQPYDIVCSLVGKPGAAAIVYILTAVRTIHLAANFSGAQGSLGANPTSTAAYDVQKNGSSIGTVSISTSGVFTFTTASGTSKSLAAGDRLTIIAPSSQDATLSDVGFTLIGTR